MGIKNITEVLPGRQKYQRWVRHVRGIDRVAVDFPVTSLPLTSSQSGGCLCTHGGFQSVDGVKLVFIFFLVETIINGGHIYEEKLIVELRRSTDAIIIICPTSPNDRATLKRPSPPTLFSFQFHCLKVVYLYLYSVFFLIQRKIFAYYTT